MGIMVAILNENREVRAGCFVGKLHSPLEPCYVMTPDICVLTDSVAPVGRLPIVGELAGC